MKTCILKTHSAEFAELNALTLPNHTAYADAHGYDVLSIHWRERTAKDMLWNCLSEIEKTLREYDLVLSIGSDVVFTDLKKPLAYFTTTCPTAAVIISQEAIGGSQTNADMILWREDMGAEYVIKELWRNWAHYADDPWGPQAVFNAWLEHGGCGTEIDFLPCRELQSAPVRGFPRSMWQPGDFALHFLGMPLQEKINRCKHFLTTGEVLWRD